MKIYLFVLSLFIYIKTQDQPKWDYKQRTFYFIFRRL